MALLLAVLFSCTGNQRHSDTDTSKRLTISAFNPKFAHGFKVYDGKDFKLLQIFLPWDTARPAQQFYLLQKDNENFPVPDGIIDLRIPLQSMVCFSATHFSFADALGVTDKITGALSVDFVLPPEREHPAGYGKIVEVGAGGHYDIEKLIRLNPQIVMVSMQKGRNFDPIINAGLKVLMNGDFLETTPLGRAEWIKVIGLLFGKEHEAMHIFDSVTAEYRQLQTLAQSVKYKPVVLSGKQYGGFWNIPGGRSYVARFIEDAGGRYLFEDNDETGSLSMDFEAVYKKGMLADYWRLVVFAPEGYDRKALAAEDVRYKDLPAFKNKKIMVCNTALTSYYQKGLLEPHVILADYIGMLHPRLLPSHKNVYYHLLP